MSRILKIWACVAVFLSASLVYSQEPAELISPLDEATCISNSFQLDWNPSPGNVKYSLKVSTNADLSDPIVDTTGILSDATFYDFNAPNENTIYYWAVESNYQTTPPIDVRSDTISFKTTKLPLEVTAPDNMADCLSKDVDFSFEDITDALAYVLEVAEDPNFNNIEYTSNTISETTVTVSLLKNDNTYFYRVAYRYNDGSNVCQSDWSPTRTLETRYAAPTVSNPSDLDVGVPKSLDVMWNIVQNTTSYTLQVDDDMDFSSVLVDMITANNNELIELPEDNTRYYLRLNSSDPTCTSDWSETITFLTAYEAPEPTYPINSAECVRIEDTFTWLAVPGAQSYTVQLSESLEFDNIELEVKDIAGTEASIITPKSLTRYYWRVRAEDADNLSAWSEVHTYETTSFPPILKNPEDGDTEVLLNPTLEWESLDPVTFYGVQVADDISFAESSIIFEDMSVNNETMDITLGEYNTAYYWRVSATYSECESGWSDISTFTTVRGWPDLLFPANDSTNISTNPLVRWGEVKGADLYDLELAQTSDFTGTTLVQLYSLNSLANVFTDLNETTQYFWRVRSKNQYGVSDWSPTFRFTTGFDDPDAVVLISPPDASSDLDVDIEFIWGRVKNADNYDFHLSFNSSFSDTVSIITMTTDTNYTVTGLQNNKAYYWRVRSRNNTDVSEWSNYFRFGTIELAPTDAPVLLLPENNAININLVAQKFSWSKVEDADRYELQIAYNESFAESELKENRTGVTDTIFSVFDFEPLTLHYWRVRAKNSGGLGPWSDVSQFTTVDPISVGEDYSSEIMLAPNPVTENAFLTVTEKVMGISKIMIVSVTGKTYPVSEYSMSLGTIELPLKSLSLPIGTYYLWIEGEGFHASLPFQVGIE